MTSRISPYPNISAAAWTILLRAGSDEMITAELAAAYVGTDLASSAVAELDAAHLLDEGRFTPLANSLRRWHRQRREEK
jgi:hypothetical protein